MKILIAADGSDYTKRMLDYLAAHAEWFSGSHKFTVITVVPAATRHVASYLDKKVLDDYYSDEGEKVLKPVRQFMAKHGIEADYVLKAGHAADLISKQADSNGFDLVVLGSHGHGAFGTMVMGSVANKVLAQSKTPLLLIR